MMPGRRRRLHLALLILAIGFQALLTWYYYSVDHHRLAGIDFYAYFYPQTTGLMVDYGLLPMNWLGDRCTVIAQSTPFQPVTKVYLLDAGYYLFFPFTCFDLQTALFLFLAANLIASSWAVYLLARRLGTECPCLWSALFTVAAPVHYNLLHAHSIGLYLLVLTLIVLAERRYLILASCALALFLIHKIYLLPLLLLLFPARRYRFAFFTFLWLIPFSLFGRGYFFSFSGIERHLSWYTSHTASSVAMPVNLLQAGTSELIYRLFHGAVTVQPLWYQPSLVKPLYVVLVLTVLFITTLTLWRHSRAPASAIWALIFATSLLVTPSLNDYMLLMAYIPLLIMGVTAVAGKDEPKHTMRLIIWIVAAVALLGQWVFLRYPTTFGGILPPLINPEWLGLCLLWLLCEETVTTSEPRPDA